MTQMIRDLVFAAVDEVNYGLPPDLALRKAEEARLLGTGREIDSLGLVMLLTAIEARLRQDFGLSITLGAGPGDDDPFRTLGYLISHVTQCVGSGAP